MSVIFKASTPEGAQQPLETATQSPAAEDALSPLFVDMDGTLVSTDLLWESVMLLAARHPLDLWRLPFWLVRGKAAFKRELALRVLPDPVSLPYREDVVDFLRDEKRRGRKLILATASDERVAAVVAAHLELFDGVIASDGERNAEGHRKLELILQSCAGGAFGYIGNSAADLPLWAKAKDAHVVAPSRTLLRRASAVAAPRRVFAAQVPRWKPMLRALRPAQWTKNLLLLVPLLAAHQFGDPALVTRAFLALATFSACASAVYLVNDLLDVEADREHPRKRFRPFAAGSLPIPTGVLMSAVLLGAAFALSAVLLPASFTGLLGLYLVLTTAYSCFFKKRLLQDVFLLAGLYTLRIIAGGAATSLTISPWLLAFSLFFFLSLAFVKRYAELLIVSDQVRQQASGRNYLVGDIGLIESVGPSSGYLAVMVLCLYINSSAMVGMYRQPLLLWMLCPILLFWITRMWFLARRRTLSDDPVVFAATDRVSLILAAATAVIVGLSI